MAPRASSVTNGRMNSSTKPIQIAVAADFIASGLVPNNFLATAEQLSPGAAENMREMARTLTA
jgi:hypothetical protein